MSILTVWVPGEKGWKEHIDRLSISKDNITAIKNQTEEIKRSLSKQDSTIPDYSKTFIATNEQVITSINEGFERLSQINTRGFDRVTSAVEDMNSNMCYLLGIIIQKLEYQNVLLNQIYETLKRPRETEVREFYDNGISFIKQGFFDAAIDCFKRSIELNEMGKYFFPSHYQLGRLYLTGVDNGQNVINLKSAEEYLLKSITFGEGLLKINPSFKPILADCYFYYSQCFYYQLSGKQTDNEEELLQKAILNCSKALDINPNISQAHYHYAKYLSYGISKFNNYKKEGIIKLLLEHFRRAVEIDRNYLRCVIKDDLFYDGVFEPNIDYIKELIKNMTSDKMKLAENKLNNAISNIEKLESMNIKDSKLYSNEYKEADAQLALAEKDFWTDTYFGYDDCFIKLQNL